MRPRFVVLAAMMTLAACSLSSTPPTEPPTPTTGSPLSEATATPTPETPTSVPTDIFTATIPVATNSPTATATSTVTASATSPPTVTLIAVPESRVAGGTGGTFLYHNPDESEAVILIVSEFAPLTLLGRTADSEWLEVMLADGRAGWVLAADVVAGIDVRTLVVSGPGATLGTQPAPETVVPATPPPDAIVKADADDLRLRDGPGTGSSIITRLAELTPLSVVGRTADNQWLQVRIPDGIDGWVAAVYIDLNIALAPVPVIAIAPPVIPENFAVDAEVIEEGDGLRVRSAPSLAGAVLTNLDSFTALDIVGRTGDNTWMQIRTTDGASGWVWAEYLRVQIDLNSVPVTGEAVVIEPPVQYSHVITGVTSNARQIFVRGQGLGNRANVFSKVGDSLTVATYVLYPIGWGTYNLADYAFLDPVIGYFSAATARNGNSFANISLAADNGWTTEHVLNPDHADPSLCHLGETPLVCEYRVVRPAVALIMLGTNDVSATPPDQYRSNLQRIVQTSIDMGVIPVISTIPKRVGFDGPVATVNQIVTETARGFDIPLWDYGSTMQNIPQNGLLDDGVHPNFPPGDFSAAADFNAVNLQYGYVIRNVTALYVLDAVWRQVLATG